MVLDLKIYINEKLSPQLERHLNRITMGEK
jgi:hypothetical protein